MPRSEKKVKKSIARKITHCVMLLLLAAMVFLLIGAYKIVSRIVMNEAEDYAKTLLDIYSDLLTSYTNDNGKELGVSNGENVVKISNLFCNRYDVDYVYLFTVDENEETLIYSAISFAQANEHKDLGNNMIGYTTKYSLNSEEHDLWVGDSDNYTYSYKNSYGYEITSLKTVQDCCGNVFIAGVDLNYDKVYNEIIVEFLIIVAIITVVILSVGFALYLFTKKNISKPVKKITGIMQEYISDGKRSDVRLDDSGTDEYAVIAGAFNSMSDDISQYVDNIKTLSMEQAGQQAELKIAEDIQRGFLPSPKAEFGNCTLHALMNPAKNVGGDLYDYIELDDHRVFIVIADISGKGISAAMFMAVTLTLLRQFAKLGLSPDEILRQTNDALSENNSNLLFATAFVGIYDSCSGSFTYSNAGHNLPYIVGDNAAVLDGAAGTVLGLFEGESYESKTISIGSGDTIFLYTDGITEAVNSEHKFFGNDRLEKTLSGFTASGNQNLVDYVFNAVRGFSKDTEQFDDITMLALHITGNTASDPMAQTLFLDYDIKEFSKIKEVILSLPIPRETQLNLCLAAEEIFVNICEYAFEGGAPEGEQILFTMEYSDRVILRFTDGGMPFNPLEDISTPDEDMEPDIGGLGRFLCVSLCDETKYEYNNGKNVLTMIKYCTEEQS